jgi:hypothetical protein
MSTPSKPGITPTSGDGDQDVMVQGAGSGTIKAVRAYSEPPRQPSTTAETMRVAADFLDAAGVRNQVNVICGHGRICVDVWEPYLDPVARVAIVARLAAETGGVLQRRDRPDWPDSEICAEGMIVGLKTEISTHLAVRRSATVAGRKPLAESSEGEVAAVTGTLPDGWRWVTELDAKAKRPAPQEPGIAAATTSHPDDAVRVAARDHPLTNKSLNVRGPGAVPAASSRQAAATHRTRRL